MTDHLDRIVDKIDIVGECWEWTAYRDRHGYGTIKHEGANRLAHRVVYEAVVEQIPPGLTLDHLCRNRACVNPDHLEPVPGRVNTLRGEGLTAANARKVSCIHGHLFTPENTIVYAGKRQCRTCHLRVRREARARRRMALIP